MDQPMSRTCPRCGLTRVTADRFCVDDGTPLIDVQVAEAPTVISAPLPAPPPAPPVYVAPTVTSPPVAPGQPWPGQPWPQAPQEPEPRGRRLVLVLVGVVVAIVLVAVVGIGATLAFRSGKDDSPTKADPASTAPSTASSVATAPDSQGTTPAPAAAVTCWNGRDANSLAECDSPSGRQGMAWVFPSSQRPECADVTSVYPQSGRDLLLQCPASLSNGSTVYLLYSHWSDLAQAQFEYTQEGLFRQDDYASDGSIIWEAWVGIQRGGPRDGMTKGVLCYPSVPYCVVVFADNATDVVAANALVSSKPADQLRGITH